MIPRTVSRLARFAPAARTRLAYSVHTRPTLPAQAVRRRAVLSFVPVRAFSDHAPSEADAKIDEIAEQYATARDEFEIAAEETEKKTVYAADDRAAAAEEMATLKAMFESAISNSPAGVAEEIQRRVGQRIRELEQALKGLEEKALED